MTQEQISLCQTIKRLGYSSNSQVRLYGQVFLLISDPISVAENVVFVDAIEGTTGRKERIRIPLPVIHMAKQARAA